MFHSPTAYLLAFYGLYLICSGLAGFLFIGKRAKTALLSGGSMGLLALTIGHFMNQHQQWAFWAGLLQTLGLLGVFAWRASAAFLQLRGDEARLLPPFEKGKAIAFLLISSMFAATLLTLAVQLMFFRHNLYGS